MKDGIVLAAELIDSGRAAETLERLIAVSNAPDGSEPDSKRPDDSAKGSNAPDGNAPGDNAPGDKMPDDSARDADAHVGGAANAHGVQEVSR